MHLPANFLKLVLDLDKTQNPEMNKHDLIQKIKALDGISQDERAYLIDLVNTKKKYGLVWEDKPEAVEEQLRENLPVLREVVERRILGAELPKPTKAQGTQLSLEPENQEPENQEYPNHILIEGDNLHALTALTFTHENKIDVIYIDPPYNTGNKDFKYNDTFVDKEDSYRHSKWLSFMAKRLKIAKKLLSDSGVIFISIDDNEQAQLKLLSDEIFGEENFLNNIIWQKKFSPQNDAKFFSDNHDFLLAYKKTKWSINHLDRSEKAIERYKNPDNDPRGIWTSSDLTVKTYSSNYDYPIITPSGKVVNPTKGRCWNTSKERMEELIIENRIWFGESGSNTPRLKKFLSDVKEGVTPLTIWLHEEVGHNQSAKQEMKAVLHDVNLVFDTPKPVKLLDRVLKLGGQKDAVILDFFAGSGTTLHATIELNKEDGGSRQCILVTNNENNICEEVTYERNKRIIEGYTTVKGIEVEGLRKNNLRYYQTDFVKSQKSQENKRQLTALSTQLLCIKEDCYNELTAQFGLNENQAKIFTNNQGKYLVVVYYSRQQLQVYEQLIDIIQGLSDATEKIKLYAFSPEKETLVEDFIEVADKIDAVPLPDAIYNAYRATFRAIKLDKKAPVSFQSTENESPESETEETQN